MYLVDKLTFESRSRRGCSNSDYRFCRTLCCGRVGVEDDELLDFYFDASDLSRQVFIGQETSCPFCGSKDWDFEEVVNVSDVPADWKWAVLISG